MSSYTGCSATAVPGPAWYPSATRVTAFAAETNQRVRVMSAPLRSAVTKTPPTRCASATCWTPGFAAAFPGSVAGGPGSEPGPGARGVARPAEVRMEELREAVVEGGRLAPAGERVRRFALHIRDDELAPEAAHAHHVASVQVRRRLLRPAAPGGVAALVPLPSRIAEAPAVPVGLRRAPV